MVSPLKKALEQSFSPLTMFENPETCFHVDNQCDYFTNLPDRIINEILEILDFESLCSTACVSRFLRYTVSQLLSSLTSLDLSSFSPDAQTLNRILGRFKGQLKSITIDALRLNNSAITGFLEHNNIEDLILLKGSLLSHQILESITLRCPSLRTLVLELEDRHVEPEIFKNNFIHMVTTSCTRLETLSITVRGEDFLTNGSFWSPKLIFPPTVKILKLNSMSEVEAIRFIETVSPCVRLQCLSLVLDVITDHLIFTIVQTLPLLVELDLKDKPFKEPPSLPNDLSSTGLQYLSFCQRLSVLSLVRGRQYQPSVSFKSVNDLGMFLLSEGCRQLHSVRFGGFSKVTDAGFACILHSCMNLKKFEIRGAASLSDLAFHDISCSLSEVRILSCGFITGASVERLAAASDLLETLDLYSCRSVAHDCLGSISHLTRLTTLNLGATNLSDTGLAVLGAGSSPITRLSLKGCKRITDMGITLLLSSGGRISKTLSSLDIGCIPDITDMSINRIVSYASNINELCIRCCLLITNASLRVLGRGNEKGRKLLRRLDIGHCIGLSFETVEVLRNGGFCGLRWLGIGGTCLNSKKGGDVFNQIVKERPWLTICMNGCEMEMGCWDACHCPDPLNSCILD